MQILKLMFDTNIYDYILDNSIKIVKIKERGKIYITNVQISEIKNISREARRTELQNLVIMLQPIKLLLNSGIWIDQLQWDDDQPWIDSIEKTVKSLIGEAHTKPPWRDALIGEVAKTHGLTVVTDDREFFNRLSREQIPCFLPNDFFSDF